MSGTGDAGAGAGSGAGLSRRPYLLRAMHEWMGDAGFTPHIIVDAARAGVEVPTAYIKDGRIVLNVSLNATQRLQLLNHGIEFDARFAGVVHHVRVPMGAVLGIYARETGEGMVFNEGEPEAPPPGESAAPAAPGAGAKGTMRRAKLTVVK
ncbi:MAG: ClpXP protease specificity-enhancing factor [Gammaproteobacteria bacterium]|nr:ClpXP protease specificity-enhancing factor [Gammaproteobacteria bacterium]MDE2251645.1 ClpXP protease specificity-enhancing factor [Gammaproteobacteria bacterium]